MTRDGAQERTHTLSHSHTHIHTCTHILVHMHSHTHSHIHTHSTLVALLRPVLDAGGLMHWAGPGWELRIWGPHGGHPRAQRAAA